MKDTLGVLLAGGAGERLYPLTRDRAKPAVTFGGMYRIIDITLSNCLNSDLRRVYILTQYKALSLNRHIREGWNVLGREVGEFVEVLPPMKRVSDQWYQGTADAVYQNIYSIGSEQPKHVMILSGDHIYKMDYGPMIAYHVEKGADITVGVVEVPRERAIDFGVLSVTDWNRVTKFTEKPRDPDSIPSRPQTALASMGIYVFNARLLEKLLVADAADDRSQHDFGKDVIPAAIDLLHVVAYPFTDVKTRAQNYWRDVGTVDAFYDANLELVHVAPELNLYDEEWPIWTYQLHQPPAKFVLDEEGRRGTVVNSMVSGGCIVSGAFVNQSLLFSNVRVEERSNIMRSVVMPNVKIGAGCSIARAIIDENCEIPDGMHIGIDPAADRQRFYVTDNGVVLVTPDMLAKVALTPA